MNKQTDAFLTSLRLIQRKTRGARTRLEKPHHTTSDRHAAEADLIEIETLIEQLLTDIASVAA